MSVTTIRNKLCRLKGVTIITYGLLATTVLFLFLALFSALHQSLSTPVLFDAINNKENQYCYIDVIGLDEDWVAERGDDHYYTVVDAEGYLDILQISDANVEKMQHQISYYNGETEEVEAVRLNGTVVEIVSELKDIYADVYGISDSDVENYFGYYYLDTTTGAISSNSVTWIWLLFALFSGLIFLVFAIVYFPAKKNFNSCLKNITDAGDEDICAAELENMGKEKIYFGENYLYCASMPFAVKYTDIQWAYISIQRVYGIQANQSICLRSKLFPALSITLPNKNNQYDSIFAKLMEKNPEIIVGYNSKYEQMFKPEKKKK